MSGQGRAVSGAIGQRIEPVMIEAFWERVFVPGQFDCWLWVCKSPSRSYPQHHGIAVHRLAWYLAKGSEPLGQRVCHVRRDLVAKIGLDG